MEYLNSIEEKLESIDEKDIVYYDIFEYPELVFGNLNFANSSVNFSKFPKSFIQKINELNNGNNFITDGLTFGYRIRFKTLSSRIILKIELKEEPLFNDVAIDNSKGFDIYSLNNDRYVPLKVITPLEDKNIFAECITNEENDGICIFLPNFAYVKKMFIGIEKNTSLTQHDYLGENKLPILFYGNENMQGILASKSGNSYPNIVSKYLDQDVINLSVPVYNISKNLAEYIGKINCYAIVIEFNIESNFIEKFSQNFKDFYKIIRGYHPNTKIILITTACYNNYKNDQIIDELLIKTCKNDDNTYLINQKELFDNNDSNADSIMNKLAMAICNIFKKEI